MWIDVGKYHKYIYVNYIETYSFIQEIIFP